MCLPATIRHRKIEKKYPLLIGSIPIYTPSASTNEQTHDRPPLPEASHSNVPDGHLGFFTPDQAGASSGYNIRKELIPKLHYLLFNVIFIEAIKRHILKLQLRIIFQTLSFLFNLFFDLPYNDYKISYDTFGGNSVNVFSYSAVINVLKVLNIRNDFRSTFLLNTVINI